MDIFTVFSDKAAPVCEYNGQNTFALSFAVTPALHPMFAFINRMDKSFI